MNRPTRKQLDEVFEQLKACETPDCRASVMDQIQSGRLKMRSRWFVLTEYFGLRTTWVILLLTCIALINLILFMISQSPERALLDFGSSSSGVILQNLPYGWLAFATTLLIGALVMMRKFSFTYIWSFHLFVIFVISSVFVSGGITFASGLNDALFEKYVMDDENNSLLAKLYCFCTNRTLDSDKALVGEVFFETNPGEFVIQTPELDVVTVMHGEGTEWHGEDSELYRFQGVKMLGQRYGDTFIATHIKLEEEPVLATAEKKACDKSAEFERMEEIAELRRKAIDRPMTPGLPVVQVIRSIY